MYKKYILFKNIMFKIFFKVLIGNWGICVCFVLLSIILVRLGIYIE